MALFRKYYHSPGTAPGTLITSSAAATESPTFSVVNIKDGHIRAVPDHELDQIHALKNEQTSSWIRITGHPTAEWMKQHGTQLGLHPLAQEDILNGGQRPKLEPYDDQLFIVMNFPEVINDQLHIEQLYLFCRSDLLVSFYTGSRDPFEQLVKRLGTPSALPNGHGIDYLIYAILDLAIDTAFPVLEHMDMELESLEEQLMGTPDRTMLNGIHAIKQKISRLRRAIWPQRDVINHLLRDEGNQFTGAVRLYLRDCYDHSVQIMEMIESYREMSASLHDLYMSGVSMRMNDIMRILTIITTVFIPLSFITGVYGMNFAGESSSPWAMPELRWPYTYPLIWLTFLLIASSMLIWFRRKGWL